MRYSTDRMNSLVKAACLTIAVGMLPVATGAHAQTLEKLTSQKKLSIGWIPYQKLAYRDLNSQQVKGALVEIVTAITKQLNVPEGNVEFVETDWGNFGVGLSAGKFDLSIASTFQTIPRATAVAFTRPLFYLGNSALVRKDDDRFKDVKSVYDLDRPGITIAVIAGEQSEEFTRRNFTKATVKSIKASDISAAMLEVVAGRADVGLGDSGIVSKFAQIQPSTLDLFKTNPWNVQGISWAVQPNDTKFLNFLNTAIQVLQASGTLREILRKPEYADTPFLISEVSLQPINR